MALGLNGNDFLQNSFFVYLARRFLFLSFVFCSSLPSLFNFNNNLACSFLKTSFFNTLQRSSLCNVYNSCSLCFSFHLFHSHRRSWPTGTRNQTVLKFSFFWTVRTPKENPFNTQTSLNRMLHCELNCAKIK